MRAPLSRVLSVFLSACLVYTSLDILFYQALAHAAGQGSGDLAQIPSGSGSPLWTGRDGGIRWQEAGLQAASASPEGGPAPARPDIHIPGVQEVLNLLESRGILKGPDDPLRAQLLDPATGGLTTLGLLLYQQALSDPEAAQSLDTSLERLRTSGAWTPEKEEKAQRIVASIRDKLGSVSSERSFLAAAQLQAVLSGGVVDEAKPQYDQVTTAKGHLFWDKDGLAYRLDAQRKIVYSRKILQQQRTMNQTRPVQAPPIPESGQYNHEMLQYSYWRLRAQYDERDLLYHVDRTVGLAQLLGKQYKDDQWIHDRTLERDLENQKTVGGHVAKSLVDPKLASRLEYMGQARGALEAFKSAIDNFKGASFMTEEILVSFRKLEQSAAKLITLAYLEELLYKVRNQLETLDPSAPGHEDLAKSIREAPVGAHIKAGYKRQGELLKQRAQKMQEIVAQVREMLKQEDPEKGLDQAQAALSAAQKEFGRLSLDFMVYAVAPALARASHDQNSNNSTLSFSKLWDYGARTFTPKGGFTQKLDKIVRMDPTLKAMMERISRGDFDAARKRMIELEPDALQEYWSASLNPPPGGSGVTEAQRLQAAMQKSQTILGDVAKVHFWTDIAGNFLLTTAAIAIAAPAASFLLTGLSRAAYGVVAWSARMGPITRFVVGTPAKILGEVTEHTAIRLSSISPDPAKLWFNTMNPYRMGFGSTSLVRLVSYTEASAIRFVNHGGRQLAFTGLASGFSGVFVGGKHLFDGDHSPFGSVWEASWEGAKGGMKWANSTLHPSIPIPTVALLYVGFPSTVFEGTRLASVAKSLGERGLVGNTTQLLKTFGMPFPERLSLQAMSRSGKLGTAGASTLGLADNLAKYAAFSHATGWAGKHYSYRSNLDTEDVERRIKRAERDGVQWLMSPLWLLIPVYPAKYEAAGAGHLRALQGMRQYREAGRTHEIANAAVGQQMTMLKPIEVPAMQKMFQMSWKGRQNADLPFTVTREMKLEAIREALPLELGASRSGKGAVDPMSVEPIKYFEISELPDGHLLGKTPGKQLYVNEYVKGEAQGFFEKAILKSPDAAGTILQPASAGRQVAGFGKVTAGLQEDVARVLYRASKDGLAKVPKDHFTRAMEILKPYQASAEVRNAKAGEFVSSLRANRSPSKNHTELVDAMLERTRSWKEAQQDPKSPDASKGYMDLMAEFKQMVEARRANLSPKETAVFHKTFEFIEAVDSRLKTAPLRDSKGTRIESLRPGQFEAVMEFLGNVAKGGDAGRIIQKILLGKTGVGKTVIALEVLIPFAEAHAAQYGKKVIYLTVQPNLKSQLEVEKRAFRITDSTFKIDTWDNFTTLLAQGKLFGRLELPGFLRKLFKPKGSQSEPTLGGKAEDYWVIADEADRMGSDPAKTIGEITGEIPQEIKDPVKGTLRPNPLYTTFAEMDAQMYSIAYSSLRKAPQGAEFRTASGRVFTPDRVAEVLDHRVQQMARYYGLRLFKELYHDPVMSPNQKFRFMWDTLISGLTGKGWVYRELYALARGHLDNPAGFRIDHLSKKVNIVHIGSWHETMDNAELRHHELRYGAKTLRLPYDHRTISTFNDVAANRRVNFIGITGTPGGKALQAHLAKNKIGIIGTGSNLPKNTEVVAVDGPTGQMSALLAAVRRAQANSEALVVVALPDTRTLKVVRRALLRTGAAKPDQIAQLFSDIEWLRLNRPQARVQEQMNLRALDTGGVKVLLLDVQMGGRGVDLNFKGQRNSKSPKAFQGYKDFEMHILGPEDMSQPNTIQAIGRIDVDRVPKGAERRFRLVVDLRVIREDPLFQQIQRSKGKDTPLGEVVAEYLEQKQVQVEENELRSSGVSDEPAAFDPKYRGLRH